MKKLGLIGGMGPESTVPYYHDIVYGVQNRLGRDVFPNLTIESVDVFQVLGMCTRQDYDGLVEYLLTALRNLAAAGAEFGALSANTPHIVFNRLEQESLELFLGRRVVTTETRRFRVTPAEGKLQQIVCRFSPDAGLLPANDLTGDIVLLQYEPQGMAVDEAGVRPTSSTIPYRIAALTRCSLIAAGQEQAAQVLPVFQFGRTIALQVPRNR